MDSTELKIFGQRVGDQLFGHILPFWCGPAVDWEQGGWLGWLSNDLRPDRTQPKGLIVNARILWTFSAVYQVRPDNLFGQMADRAFDYVMNRFWDTQYGGAFWRLDETGRVMDDSKKIYGQAFYIYALSEYHRAFGVPAALARAREQFELIEKHAHDAKFGGYLEVCRRDWSEAGAEARLSDQDMNEKKSMNNHLHVLEAYTHLYRVWREARVGERLCELIGLFEERILDARTRHLNHFFDEAWQVRSNSYTFGHDIEAAWLLCEAAEVLNDAKLLEQMRNMALRMAEVTLKEGVDADGGLCHEGKGGQIIDRGKEWWPQAEAVIGFLNAFQISKDTKYLDAARRVWDFIEQHLVDRVHGEWFWRITPEGQVDATLPKVSEWKGPYHAARTCLETLQRVNEINRQPINLIE
jgi:cellobiose epimerase